MLKGLIPTEVRDQLKTAYDGQLFVYRTKDKKHEIVYRPLNKDIYQKIKTRVAEEKDLSQIQLIESLNQYMFDHCVVWPELSMVEKENLSIGIVPSVAKSIQEQSGFTQVDVLGNVWGPDLHTLKIKDFDYWADISDDEIAELKQTSPYALYKVKVEKWYFVVRPMTRQDVRYAAMSTDDQLTLVQSVTVWPPTVPWDQIPTGVIETIGYQVNMISGWNSEDPEVYEL